MQLKYKFILATIALGGAMAMILETLSDQIREKPEVRYHSVFKTETTADDKKTLYLYWPTYFGAARIPLNGEQSVRPND